MYPVSQGFTGYRRKNHLRRENPAGIGGFQNCQGGMGSGG
jgi:hypothetical protein